MKVLRQPNLEALIRQAADDFELLVASIVGEAHIVFTGGGAGIGLLKELRTRDIEWTRIHAYFGDERNVPVSHPDSNEGQARKALFDHVDATVHGYGLDGSDMSDAVEAYENTLPESFDLHLLGMGGEGHINSLFPHTDAVKEPEAKVVAVTDSPKPPAQRATLTLPAVHSAREVWLLVAGEEKAEAASHVIAESPAEDWPAAGAQATRLYLA